MSASGLSGLTLSSLRQPRATYTLNAIEFLEISSHLQPSLNVSRNDTVFGRISTRLKLAWSRVGRQVTPDSAPPPG